jgi:hypothetical protein
MSVHVDLTRGPCRRVGALAIRAPLALVPSSALAATSKPKPYTIYTMSEAQIS